MKRKNYISKNSQILENNFLFFNKITLGENNMDKNLFVTKSYWNGNGKHQKEMDRLFDQLVPDHGSSNTVEGEILRAANRIYYDYYNNGMCNNTSGAVRFLNYHLYYRRGIDKFEPLKKIYDNCNTGFHTFENLEIPLENMMDKAIEYVICKNGQYQKSDYYCKNFFELQEKDHDKYKQRLVLEKKRYRENNPPLSKRYTLKGLNKLLSKDGCIIKSNMLGYRNEFSLFTPDGNDYSGYKRTELYFKMIHCRLDHLHKIYLDHGIEGLLKYDVDKIQWPLVSTITYYDSNEKQFYRTRYLLNQDMEVWFLLEKDKDRKSTYSLYLETQSGTKFISTLKIKSRESKRSIFLLTKGEQFLEKIIKLKTGEYEKWFLHMIDLKTKNIVDTYGIKDQSI